MSSSKFKLGSHNITHIIFSPALPTAHPWLSLEIWMGLLNVKWKISSCHSFKREISISQFVGNVTFCETLPSNSLEAEKLYLR
jgi:hypothetical protein